MGLVDSNQPKDAPHMQKSNGPFAETTRLLNQPRTSDSWPVFKARSGLEVTALCVTATEIKDHSKEAADFSFDGMQTIVDVIHDTKSKAWSWRVRIEWVGGGQREALDNAGVCRGCGRKIVAAVVTPEGRVLVGHN